jgi:Zn-dependent peptidase ImmA (M78 family)
MKRSPNTVRSLAIHLRKSLPTKKTVLIRCQKEWKHKKTAGFCYLGKKYYYIFIDGNMAIQSQIDTLVHEWAHLLNGPWLREEHPQSFWIEHGKVYKAYIEWVGV